MNNGVRPLDTTGAPVDAHDGTIVQDPAGTLWLVGTSYGCGFIFNAPSPWCGVRIYRSTDLATWAPAGAVAGKFAFDASGPAWQSRCSGDNIGCFRPHIARRPDGVWVMWLAAPSTAAGYAVLTAPAPEGPYTEQAPPTLAYRGTGPHSQYGDMDLTPDGAQAWLTYVITGDTGTPARIVVEQLDTSWTSGRGHPSWTGLLYRGMTESPALWRGPDGRWHLTASDAAPYGITATRDYTALRPIGPWWATPGPVSVRSCEGQSADVSPLHDPVGALRYVWQVDRWQQSSTGHGLPAQAGATTYLAPLTLAADGSLPPQSCVATWTW